MQGLWRAYSVWDLKTVNTVGQFPLPASFLIYSFSFSLPFFPITFNYPFPIFLHYVTTLMELGIGVMSHSLSSCLSCPLVLEMKIYGRFTKLAHGYYICLYPAGNVRGPAGMWLLRKEWRKRTHLCTLSQALDTPGCAVGAPPPSASPENGGLIVKSQGVHTPSLTSSSTDIYVEVNAIGISKKHHQMKSIFALEKPT